MVLEKQMAAEHVPEFNCFVHAISINSQNALLQERRIISNTQGVCIIYYAPSIHNIHQDKMQ